MPAKTQNRFPGTRSRPPTTVGNTHPMARPAKAADERLSERAALRFTSTEWVDIKAAASARRTRPSTLLRQLAVAALRDLPPAWPTAARATPDAKLLRELNGVGSNLNQAVKRMHQGDLDPAEFRSILEDVARALADVRALLLP